MAKVQSERSLVATKESTEEYGDYDEDEFETEAQDEDDLEEDEERERRKKLAKKPPKAVRTCGKSSNQFDLSNVPNTAKLSQRRKSALGLLMQGIPKPEGAVPSTALPTWYNFSMNDKIPLVPAPANYIYYSRGKIGQPLLRPHPFYTLWDERNLERVVGAPYSALHDPHAKRYMTKPGIKSFLLKQGLVNDKNEVICSLREFNKFRGYLRTQYNDEVQGAVSSGDSNLKWERQQLQMIRKYLSDTEGQGAFLNQRRINANKVKSEAIRTRSMQILDKQKKADQRLVKFNEKRSQENLDKVLKGCEKQKQQAERYFGVMQRRLDQQRATLKESTLRDMIIADRRKNDTLLSSSALHKFKLEWIDSKLEYSSQRAEQDSKLEEAMRDEIKTNAKKRQKKVEHYRSKMPALVEKKKQEEKRLWEIVRKYAMRWLEKVRKRLNAPKDVQHESVWIGHSKGVMDDTLKTLKEISGYEKMDDFVLNIIKLKKQIQQQIVLEEAQEAEEAAKAAAEAEQADGEKKEGKAPTKEDQVPGKQGGPENPTGSKPSVAKSVKSLASKRDVKTTEEVPVEEEEEEEEEEVPEETENPEETDEN